jgi:hypothetical protein
MHKLILAAATITSAFALTAPAATAAVFTFPVDGTATGCAEDVYVSGTYKMIINNAFPQSRDRYVQTVHFVYNVDAIGVTSGATYQVVSVLGQTYMEHPVIEDRLRTITIVSTSKVIGNGQTYTVRFLTHVTFGADYEPIVVVDEFEATCS